MKIALFGGSFNPIHNGHLIVAEYVRDLCKFDKFIFVPTGNAPHKSLIDANLRYDMVRVAIVDNEYFRVSRCEIDRAETSYTVDTARHFRKLYPNDDIYFLIGLDTLLTLSSWKDLDELSSMMRFLVMKRELDTHISNDEIKAFIARLNAEHGTDVELIHSPIIQISSTDIRRRIALNDSVKYQISDEIYEIIDREGLYRYTNSEHIDILKRDIGEQRLLHSFRVADTAVEIAERYGFDIDRVKKAAVYHDCAKFLDKERLLKKAIEFGIINQDAVDGYTPYLHQYVGYFVAKETYGIEDESILNAIKKHTTGSADMSQLDKIIYLADYIEPERCFKGVEEVRISVYENLDKAMYLALSQTIDHLEQIGKNVDSESREALNYFKDAVNK